MPGVFPVYGMNKDINKLADEERKARLAEIDLYQKWYDGKHPATLAVATGERDDNITINLCGQLIDDTQDMIGMPAFSALDGDARVQDMINMLVDGDGFAGTYQDSIEDGLVSGHSFVRLLDDGSIGLIDPRLVNVFWDITRFGLRKSVLWYRITWRAGDKARIQDIVPKWLVNEGVAGWVIIEYMQDSRDEFIEVARDDWDYDFAPIVDWQTERRPHHYYGVSMLQGVINTNNAVNFVASNTGRIIKFHGHPRTIVVGDDVSNLTDSSVDGVYSLPNPNAKVMNLEMQSDLKSSMEYLTMLRGAFFSSKRAIDLSSVRDKVGALTNFGVRMLFLSMINMVNGKRELIGAGWADVVTRWLAVNGIDSQVEILWGDSLPVDRKEVVATVQGEKDLGLTSDSTLAQELGRDFASEQEKIADEQMTRLDDTTAFLNASSARGVFNANT